MIRQQQLFLSNDDEVAFSNALKVARPQIAFIDGDRWDSPVPLVADSIAACTSRWTFLWDQNIVKPFEGLARKDGKFEGPTAGWVIEVTRSIIQNNLMLSGRIAASTGISDRQLMAAMDGFVLDVWKVLRRITQPVVSVDPKTGDFVNESVPQYRAGHHAAVWASSNPDHYFRDRSTQNFFKPKKLV